MQGGIHRNNKHDLLPRYKNGSGDDPIMGTKNRRKSRWLTTPMKKIIAYVFFLIILFYFIQSTSITGNQASTNGLDKTSNEQSITTSNSGKNNELSTSGKHAMDILDDPTASGNTGTTGTTSKVSKSKFNNEVAMQQEIKNLENDIYSSSEKETASDAEDRVGGSNPIGADGKKSGISGNKVKALKQEKGAAGNTNNDKVDDSTIHAPYKKSKEEKVKQESAKVKEDLSNKEELKINNEQKLSE
ncbi:uncharacterized protein SCODWIG_01975 [Saccharomycodes ludwigii]|uniref:Uncharacterized protein n=1 Tax=Saccharomycodes ludwigii TaxID=36035 RepID=A0A376B6V9_9ASCO|nr:hypothetical protein SCDLUD_004146 [Saccharomycodes ludwigii]KAH3899848.1 hypothetical protein SCDLUD_004146 [Saccharomycodes ludwigii]SSD60214.1 uncharacterized protein SCODWIG_01975 [Saccharomycodes ludwigii]